ncbi:hypothetical protein Tco_0982678, partial [Tanacetum coccineum]
DLMCRLPNTRTSASISGVLLSLIPSAKVFDAANIWNFHVSSDMGSRRVKLTSKKKSLCRFLKDLMDNIPSTLEDLMGSAKIYAMMDAKRGCEQSDDGSRFSVDSLYESDSILEFDGAVKGNRGSAGAGVHILDLSYLTFSIDADEEKLISCERTDVNLL